VDILICTNNNNNILILNVNIQFHSFCIINKKRKIYWKHKKIKSTEIYLYMCMLEYDDFGFFFINLTVVIFFIISYIEI